MSNIRPIRPPAPVDLDHPAPPPTLRGAVERVRMYLDAAREIAEERWGAGTEHRRPDLVVQVAALIAADINSTPERDS